MASRRKSIAVIASEECRTSPPAGKRWFHLRRFVLAYRPLLAQYRILTTDLTAGLIIEALEDRPSDSNSRAVKKNLVSMGSSFPALVHIAAEVAKKRLRRVLMFQDPRDLRLERAERYALIRNCNLVGAHLYVNSSAHLWALWQSGRCQLEVPWPYVTEPVKLSSGEQETVALIAHDNEKERMGRFVLRYRDVLSRFPKLVGTSGTIRYLRKLVDDALPVAEAGLTFDIPGATAKQGHGPTGGDVIIADQLFRFYRRYRYHKDSRFRFYSFHHVIFFADFKSTHAHEADIRVLLKACVDPSHRVNLLLNSQMAKEWAERYGAS